MSDDARLLMVYLIACPHGNAIGCFVLPNGYITEDISWSSERVAKRLTELQNAGLIERDEPTRVTRVCSWWEHNSIDNSNVAKGAVRITEELPKCSVLSNAVSALLEHPSDFLVSLKPRLELVSTGFGNNETDTETETETMGKSDRALRLQAVRAEEKRIDGLFNPFWELVPKKTDKDESMLEFRAALKHTPVETIMAAMPAWRQSVQGKEKKYIKSPKNWLKGKHWQDELDTGLFTGGATPRKQAKDAWSEIGLDWEQSA